MSEQDEKIINLGGLKKFKENYDSKIIAPINNKTKALEYVINNSNRLSYSGETITNFNSAVGDIRNVVVNGNTRYKKSDGAYTDTWESGVSLESMGEVEKDSNNKYPIEVVSCGGKNLAFSTTVTGDVPIEQLSKLLKVGTTYTISGTNSNTDKTAHVVLYNKDGSKAYDTNLPAVFEMTSNITRASFMNDLTWESCTINKLQIEKGVSATTFEEPKQSKRTILLDSPLRKVSSISDSLDLEKKEIIRNCKGIVLDSNINGYEANSKNGKKGYHIQLSIQAKDGILKCDKFKVVNEYIIWEETSGIYIKSNEIYIYHNGESLADFKTWLQSNPVTIIYALATPTTEDIEVSPTDNSLTSYASATALTTNNTVKGNINADMPTNLSGVIAQQGNLIATLQNNLLETQTVIVENEYNNLINNG